LAGFDAPFVEIAKGIRLTWR